MRKNFFQIIRAEPYWTANFNFTSHIAHRRIKTRLEFVGRTGVPPNGPPLVSTIFYPGPTNIFWGAFSLYADNPTQKYLPRKRVQN